MLGWKLNELAHTEGGAALTSLIDMVVDVLSFLLLVCAVVLLLYWRVAARRRARYELAVGGSSALELGSVSHTSAGLRVSDSAPEDSDRDTQPQPVVLNQHTHEQLLDTQRQMLVLLGDLTAELRTLRSIDAAP